MAGDTSTQSASGGLGCGTVLFFIFLVLKLLGKITWSWWWVTAPLWIPLVLAGLFLVTVAAVHLLTKR